MNYERINMAIEMASVESVNEMLKIENMLDEHNIKEEHKDFLSTYTKIRKSLLKIRSKTLDEAMDELFLGVYKKAKELNFSTIIDCCFIEDSLKEEALKSFNNECENKEMLNYVDNFCKLNNIGYVYFIKGTHKGEEKYKIGKAMDLESRMRSFEVIIPFDIDVIYAVRVKNPLKLESLLHQTYSEKRVQGEWFDFTKDEIILVVFLMKMLSNILENFATEWKLQKEKESKLNDDDYIDYLESILVMNNVAFNDKKRLKSGKTF
jgi:hypothetical protein